MYCIASVGLQWKRGGSPSTGLWRLILPSSKDNNEKSWDLAF
jgi:hypothetical protein